MYRYTSRVLVLLIVLLCVWPETRAGDDGDWTSEDAMTRARLWCDSTALDNIEGLWLIPSDNIYVLVCRNSSSDMTSYTLTVAGSADGALIPGHQLGKMMPMADRKTYMLQVPQSRDRHDRLQMGNVRMELAQQGDALVVVAGNKAIRYSFSPLNLLPGFWRMVRLSITPSNTAAVRGMVKVYPGYDGNGSQRSVPRYF